MQCNANPFHTAQVVAISLCKLHLKAQYCIVSAFRTQHQTARGCINMNRSTGVTCSAMQTPYIQLRWLPSPCAPSISKLNFIVSAFRTLHQTARGYLSLNISTGVTCRAMQTPPVTAARLESRNPSPGTHATYREIVRLSKEPTKVRRLRRLTFVSRGYLSFLEGNATHICSM